ncbi:MAG: hypothetical protein M1819_000721 [Sarea resinae]|nr:MAG: hypothetical protein M1819_000721 [Sarea resinae]
MLAESIASHTTLASQARSLVQMRKPIIEIALKNADRGSVGSYIGSYTTLDTIEGQVAITATHDTRFEDVQITFEGSMRTSVERMSPTPSPSSGTEASKTFLNLSQPVDESCYPHPRVAEAGRTYRFPFTFVVPPQQLPSSCPHRCENPQLHDAHLHLPPSLGDPSLSGNGKQLLDDLAPDMSKISYAIKVRITRKRECDGKRISVTEATKKVRIVPAFAEQPPLAITEGGDEGDYVLRREKAVKRGLFKGKLGHLVMQTSQPKSFHLPAPNSLSACPSNTMATIKLRFDAADQHSLPPRLGQLTAKLKAVTYYSSSHMSHGPSKAAVLASPSRGVYIETVPLSSRSVESARWEKHEGGSDCPNMSRRDSATSTTSCSDIIAPSSSIANTNSSGGGKPTPFYTTTVLVPLSLPKSKSFPPSFHSCLVSRVYVLDLVLAFHHVGNSKNSASSNISTIKSGTTINSATTKPSLLTTATSPSLHLKVPLQISSAGSHAHTLATKEAASELDQLLALGVLPEADEFFTPRAVGPSSLQSRHEQQQHHHHPRHPTQSHHYHDQHQQQQQQQQQQQHHYHQRQGQQARRTGNAHAPAYDSTSADLSAVPEASPQLHPQSQSQPHPETLPAPHSASPSAPPPRYGSCYYAPRPTDFKT